MKSIILKCCAGRFFVCVSSLPSSILLCSVAAFHNRPSLPIRMQPHSEPPNHIKTIKNTLYPRSQIRNQLLIQEFLPLSIFCSLTHSLTFFYRSLSLFFSCSVALSFTLILRCGRERSIYSERMQSRNQTSKQIGNHGAVVNTVELTFAILYTYIYIWI